MTSILLQVSFLQRLPSRGLARVAWSRLPNASPNNERKYQDNEHLNGEASYVHSIVDTLRAMRNNYDRRVYDEGRDIPIDF